MIGKSVKMSRLFDPLTNRTMIVPLDHGLTQGAIPGLEDMANLARTLVEAGADALLVHRGMVRWLLPALFRRAALIVHLSGSTDLGPDAGDKRLVGSVETALRLGADAVSVHVNLGHRSEPRMIEDLGRVSEACQHWGLPLVAMMYHRPAVDGREYEAGPIAHGVRLAAELGADVVKVSYSGDPRTFARVIAAAPLPVVVAGGPKMDSELAVLRSVKEALAVGAAGVAIGRNVFQSDSPGGMVANLRRLVHGVSPQDATTELPLSQPRPEMNRPASRI